ncbi:hypothetical protein LINPERPRIM_LOCUS23082 [Linum perenne]
MSSSSATGPPSSLFLRPTDAPSLSRHRNAVILSSSSHSFLRSKNPRLLRLSASSTDLSWFLPTPNPPSSDVHGNDFNGWAIVEVPVPLKKQKKGILELYLAKLKGDKTKSETEIETKDFGFGDEDESVSEVIPESIAKHPVASRDKNERVQVSVALDSTQMEALVNLQKLKVNPKHRIVPTISLSGSLATAFDDVNIDDPDFPFIQALAEAGIIPSKLSSASLFSDIAEDGISYFYPDRYLSRKDMINWRTQLEYGISPGTKEQMSRIRADYIDVKAITSDASPEFFTDMLAGEKSIIRKVFGQSRRFQPNKPATKAQAAVALTSGRMTEAVHSELCRLEAENCARQAAIEEIRSELLERGDIVSFWNEKLLAEMNRYFEEEQLYGATLQQLDLEKDAQVKNLVEGMKEKVAMECQRQLILTLRQEIDEMSERLSTERATYVAEQCKIPELRNEALTNLERVLDAKSVLEAEIEALKTLRTWVEDEAKKSQARAKVLEEVGRRWKWDNNEA